MEKVTSDESVLVGSGVLTAAQAVHLFGFPRHAHNAFYKSGEGGDLSDEHETTARWMGQALGSAAALSLSVGLSEGSKEAKKNALKASGAAWLAGAAFDVWNANGVQKSEVAYTHAALGAAMGALCLWRGFAKDKEEAKDA